MPPMLAAVVGLPSQCVPSEDRQLAIEWAPLPSELGPGKPFEPTATHPDEPQVAEAIIESAGPLITARSQ